MPISRPEAIREKRLQLEGFKVGSSDRYDFSNRGVLWLIRLGRVDVRTVIGSRCGEMSQCGLGS